MVTARARIRSYIYTTKSGKGEREEEARMIARGLQVRTFSRASSPSSFFCCFAVAAAARGERKREEQRLHFHRADAV